MPRSLVSNRIPDHEELAAAESFNREMAELAELEHQHELRSLLQARITGEGQQQACPRGLSYWGVQI